jgi:hypothetical protein
MSNVGARADLEVVVIDSNLALYNRPNVRLFHSKNALIAGVPTYTSVDIIWLGVVLHRWWTRPWRAEYTLRRHSMALDLLNALYCYLFNVRVGA